MRFGVRSKAVEKLEDVKTNLITVRRIIFTPNVDLKDELKNTSIQITCLDEEGNVLKRVTSGDSGEVEDNENAGNENSENGGSQNGGSQNSGEQGSQQGEQGQQGDQNQQSGYALTIATSGSGSASVTHDGNAVTSGTSLNEDDEIELSITPAEGQVPTASINGSSIELTEDNGVYTGSFAMPGQASALVISTGISGEGGDGGEGLDKD